MKKQFYNTIILVLASDESVLVKKFKQIWKSYQNILLDDFKVFFVYANTRLTTEEACDNDLIFPDVPEIPFPGMIKKTIKALNWIDLNYNYKFIIRTNLSTFWDLYKTKIMIDKLNPFNTLMGTIRSVNNRYFISGTDIIMSRNMVKLLLKHKSTLLNYTLQEDQAISSLFIEHLNMPINEIKYGKQAIIEHLETVDLNYLNTLINKNFTHYRLKNIKNRETIDLNIMKILLKEIYKIDSEL